MSASNINNARCISLYLLLTLILGVSQSFAGTTTKHKIDVQGIEREYVVYRPKALPSTKPAPVALIFHGFKSDPGGMRWLTEPDKFVDQYGYLAVFPAAIDGSFNAGKGSGSQKSDVDELAYVVSLIDDLSRKEKIDFGRIHAIGFSNGAQAAALLMCRAADLLAGIAMVGHSLNIEDCRPSKPVPFAVFRGAKDPMVPFAGGGKYNLASHKETLSSMLALHSLDSDNNSIRHDKKSVRCRTYPKSSEAPKGLSCVGFNDGHTWPGGIEFQPEVFGKTNREINGYDEIFRFFGLQKNNPELANRSEKTLRQLVFTKATTIAEMFPLRHFSAADRKSLTAQEVQGRRVSKFDPPHPTSSR